MTQTKKQNTLMNTSFCEYLINQGPNVADKIQLV